MAKKDLPVPGLPIRMTSFFLLHKLQSGQLQYFRFLFSSRAVVAEVELIDGEFFSEFGFFIVQGNAVLPTVLELQVKEVGNGFKSRPVFL